jgi:hypothetical protein
MKTVENKGHPRHCGSCKHFWFDRMHHGCRVDPEASTFPTFNHGQADMWSMKCSCFEKKDKQ